METKDVLKQLEKLAQLDVDAWHAYGEAIESVEDQEVAGTMRLMQDDHERHYRALSGKITGLGGDAPEFSKDFKGFLIEGFTSARSSTGTRGALKAMETNEKMTNKAYGEAETMIFPSDVGMIIREFANDERRHLEYIREQLAIIEGGARAEKGAGRQVRRT
jgi:rubrerythrin